MIVRKKELMQTHQRVKSAVELFKESLNVGDKVEIFKRTDDNRKILKTGGIVTGLYPHIFTVLLDKGYTRSFMYKDYQNIKIKGAKK